MKKEFLDELYDSLRDMTNYADDGLVSRGDPDFDEFFSKVDKARELLNKLDNMNSKVYYVAGYVWESNVSWGDGNSYPLMPNRNTFSTLEDAMAYIEDIKQETLEEAEVNEYDVEFQWKEVSEEHNYDITCGTLEITYPDTGTIENWIIYEREVN